MIPKPFETTAKALGVTDKAFATLKGDNARQRLLVKRFVHCGVVCAWRTGGGKRLGTRRTPQHRVGSRGGRPRHERFRGHPA